MRRTRSNPATGDVAVSVVSYTKADLLRAPDAQRSLFLTLGQVNNEVYMLWGLLMQAFNGTKMKAPRPALETSFGLIFMLARLLAGKFHEASKVLHSPATNELFSTLDASDAQAMAMVEDARRASKSLGKRFASRGILSMIRNDLSFHYNPSLIEKTFSDMPDDVSLADYHSNKRGTTFFGTSETLTARAVAAMTGESDIIEGAHPMMNEIQAALSDFSDFIHAYNVAFTLAYIGRDKLVSPERIVLRDVPRADKHKIVFFMASPTKAPST